MNTQRVAEGEVVVTDVVVIGVVGVEVVEETAMNVDNQAILPGTVEVEGVAVAGVVVAAEGNASNVGSLVILLGTAGEGVVVVAAVEDVHAAHLMTAGDDHLQGADLGQDQEVAQDMVVVHEIAQNMDLVLDHALTLQTELMEMDVQCLVPGLGP